MLEHADHASLPSSLHKFVAYRVLLAVESA